jgi:exopolysaccharide production protein ExoZ
MSARSASAGGRIVSIQYLRAVAALMVFAFHAAFRGGKAESFFIGAVGVDIFFVISGFVMWTVAQAGPPSLRAFVGHRLGRIVPLYWGVTLFYVFIGLVHPSLYPWPVLDFGEVVRSLLFIPYYAQNGELDPVVAPGWTLNIEMFFYAVFALGVLVPLRWRLAYLAVVLGLVALLGILATSHPAPWVGAYGNQVVLEFLAGAAIGALSTRGWIPGPRVGLALVASAVAALGVMQVTHFAPPHLRLPVWGSPAAAMVLGGLAIERSGRLFHSRLLLALGDASYSIYLLHTLLLAGLFHLVGPRPLVLFTLGLPLVCGVSYASYRLFERPVYDRLRQLGRHCQFKCTTR